MKVDVQFEMEFENLQKLREDFKKSKTYKVNKEDSIYQALTQKNYESDNNIGSIDSTGVITISALPEMDAYIKMKGRELFHQLKQRNNKVRGSNVRNIGTYMQVNTKNQNDEYKNFNKEGKKQIQNIISMYVGSIDGIKNNAIYDAIAPLAYTTVSRSFRENLYKNCFLMAMYFQILVSSTPLDEDYEYTETGTPRVSMVKNGKLRDIDDIKKQLRKRPKVTKTHYADKLKARGEWRCWFEYVETIFGAFETEDSDTGDAEVYFGEEMFEKVADFNAIQKMTEIIIDAVKEYISDDDEKLLQGKNDWTSTLGSFTVMNESKHISTLEFGGYKQNTTKEKFGAKYSHGVKNHHSYQAPNGFMRLTQELYETLLKSGRWEGYASNLISNRSMNIIMDSFDVKNTNTPFMQKLIENGHIDSKQMSPKVFVRG